MNAETLFTLRQVTATPRFSAAVSTLRQQYIATDALKNIIVEIAKIQAQVAEVKKEGLPWSPSNRHKVDGLLIIGNAGTGKTKAVETAVDLLSPVQVGEGKQLASKPLMVTVPPSGTAGAVAKDIIVGCGLTITREPKDKEAANKVVGNIARHQPTLVVIDEASRCASPAIHTPSLIRKETGLLWTIGMSMVDSVAWPAPLVMTGLPCLRDSLYLPEADERMRTVRGEASRRFRKIRIPDATIAAEGPQIEGIIDDYCEKLGVASLLTSEDEIGARVIHASNYAFGTAIVIAQQAVALAACRDGKKGKLQRSDFAAIYHIMAGGDISANIFEVGNWSMINPNVLMPESYQDAIYKDLGNAA